MKLLTLLGWIAFALEAAFVAMLFVQRNMGDDAAGRGMATGFAIVLAPIVVVAGALFLWGQRGGPAPVFWIGLAILLAPAGYGIARFGAGMLGKVERALGRAQYGRFADPHLDRIARAIDRNDADEIERLVAEKPTDFGARDRRDHTLLGHAVHRVIEDWGSAARVPAVRALLKAGAPPAVDALSPGRTQASVSEHDLVYHLFGVGHEGAVAALDAILDAGAKPDTVEEDGRPILFSSYSRLPALEVLARHGANLKALDTKSDQLGWTPLMHWAQMRSWDLALFFFQHGVPKDYTAPDGRNLLNILEEVDPPGSEYYGPDDAAHKAFIAALGNG